MVSNNKAAKVIMNLVMILLLQPLQRLYSKRYRLAYLRIFMRDDRSVKIYCYTILVLFYVRIQFKIHLLFRRFGEVPSDRGNRCHPDHRLVCA